MTLHEAMLPHVSASMFEPKYWLSSESELPGLPDRSFRPVLLSSVRGASNSHELKHELFAKLEKMQANVYYNHLSEEIPSTFWDHVGRVMQHAQWHSNPKLVYTVNRADVRRFPTAAPIFKKPNDGEFDRIQETALHTLEPVLVFAETDDYSLIEATTYRGWVRNASLAHPSSADEQLLSDGEIAVVSKRNVFTHINPLRRHLSARHLEFGAIIPLAAQKVAVDQQGCMGNLCVFVPSRSSHGELLLEETLVRSDTGGIQAGFLPFSRSAIIHSAFELMCERYCWGDALGGHDCSSFIRDVYRISGLELPRDADQQELCAREPVVFRENHTTSDRLNLLSHFQPGDPLYMPGHTMMFLGFQDEIPYVIHDFHGYRSDDDEFIPVNQVMVSSLLIRTDNQSTFLEKLTSGHSLFLPSTNTAVSELSV